MASTLITTLIRGPHAAPASRRALDELDREVSPEVLDDLRLIASELVTNSVRHGGPGWLAVKLAVDVCGDVVRLEVSDAGTGFARSGDDQRRVGGWGLMLVDRLADRWGIRHDDRTLVWVEIDLDRRSKRVGDAQHTAA